MERLVVYDKFEANFTGYGLAILENAKDTHIKEKLNGEFALSFALPVTDPKWQYIAEENLVKFEGQLFIIREIEISRDGLSKWGYVQAEHIFFTLLEEYIEDRRAVESSAYVALDTALEGTPFSVGTVEPGTTNTAYFVQMNPVAAINRIIERWGGELRPNNWEVDLLNRRGADRGVQFRYRKNLKNIKRLVDTKSLITRLYVYGKDGLTIEEVNNGVKYIDSPNIGLWRRPKCAEIKTGIEDSAELMAYGQEYLAKHDTPFVNYELTVLELKALSGYKLEYFELGDDVRVIDEELGIDVKARIVDYDRYYKSDGTIDPSRSSVVLANFRPGIEDEIGKLQDARMIVEQAFAENSPISRFWLENIIDVLQTKINSAQSNWYTDSDGNLIFEALDGSSAMKLAGAGFAIADQKDVEGNWVWRTFGTGQGFTADLLNAGTVRAEIVEIGANTIYEPGYDPSTKIVTFYQTEMPSGGSEGDLWIDTNDNNKLYRHNGTTFISADDARIAQAITDAAQAQATADGKVTTFYQATAPTAEAVGDLWVDTDDDNQLNRWDGTNWVSCRDGKIVDFEGHITDESPHNLPSYCKLTNTGVQVFDGSGNLRTHNGQYEPGQYGQLVLGGKIYSTAFRSGAPGATTYAEIDAGDSPLRIVRSNKIALELWTTYNQSLQGGSGGAVIIYDIVKNDMAGFISAHDSSVGTGLFINAENDHAIEQDLIMFGDTSRLAGNEVVINALGGGSTFCGVVGEFKVYNGPKDSVNPTENYGLRSLYVRESPQIRFVDEGVAELANGECKIDIDPILLEVIEPNVEQTKWLFQLTPLFEYTNLYVSEIGDTYFKVKEKDGISGKFCWKISAVRKGFASYRMEEDSAEHDFLTSNWEDEIDINFNTDEEVLTSNWEDDLL